MFSIVVLFWLAVLCANVVCVLVPLLYFQYVWTVSGVLLVYFASSLIVDSTRESYTMLRQYAPLAARLKTYATENKFVYDTNTRYMFLVTGCENNLPLIGGFGYHGNGYSLPRELLYVLNVPRLWCFWVPFAREFFMFSGAKFSFSECTTYSLCSVAVALSSLGDNLQNAFNIARSHHYTIVPCFVPSSDPELWIHTPITTEPEYLDFISTIQKTK